MRSMKRAESPGLLDAEIQLLSCNCPALFLPRLVYDSDLQCVVAGVEFSERQHSAGQDAFWRHAPIERLYHSGLAGENRAASLEYSGMLFKLSSRAASACGSIVGYEVVLHLAASLVAPLRESRSLPGRFDWFAAFTGGRCHKYTAHRQTVALKVRHLDEVVRSSKLSRIRLAHQYSHLVHARLNREGSRGHQAVLQAKLIALGQQIQFEHVAEAVDRLTVCVEYESDKIQLVVVSAFDLIETQLTGVNVQQCDHHQIPLLIVTVERSQPQIDVSLYKR